MSLAIPTTAPLHLSFTLMQWLFTNQLLCYVYAQLSSSSPSSVVTGGLTWPKYINLYLLFLQGPLPSLVAKRPLKIQLGSLGECCKLPHRSGQSPAAKRFSLRYGLKRNHFVGLTYLISRSSPPTYVEMAVLHMSATENIIVEM